MHMCILLFTLFDFSFVDFPSVLWYCWLGLLICKNRRPYNLYCVGADVKPYSINQSYPRPLDRMSDTLTTAPSIHQDCAMILRPGWWEVGGMFLVWLVT